MFAICILIKNMRERKTEQERGGVREKFEREVKHSRGQQVDSYAATKGIIYSNYAMQQ